jgi:hypothetical protein
VQRAPELLPLCRLPFCGNRLLGLTAVSNNSSVLLQSRHHKSAESRAHIREGFHHTSIDIPQADYARFKAFCAARPTSMQAELPAFIAQQIADPNVHLTESLYVPLSPELKVELKRYARQATISFVCGCGIGP